VGPRSGLDEVAKQTPFHYVKITLTTQENTIFVTGKWVLCVLAGTGR